MREHVQGTAARREIFLARTSSVCGQLESAVPGGPEGRGLYLGVLYPYVPVWIDINRFRWGAWAGTQTHQGAYEMRAYSQYATAKMPMRPFTCAVRGGKQVLEGSQIFARICRHYNQWFLGTNG